MNNKLKQLFPVLLMTLSASSGFAATFKSWIPDNDNALVISFESNLVLPQKVQTLFVLYQQDKNDLTRALDLVDGYFSIANLPGNSRYYDSAEAILIDWLQPDRLAVLSPQQTARLNLSQANLLQQQHEFIQANTLLEKISDTSDYYAQAQLILSRSQLILGNPQAAEINCRKLLSHGQLGIAQLCLADTIIAKGDAAKSYAMLQEIEKRTEHMSLATQQWLYQLLGSAAHQLDNNLQAQQWFAFQLDAAPVSQWLLWSKLAFANQNYAQIYTRLSALASANAQLEDSLLLRLARAEIYLAKPENKWKEMAQQRMQLRLIREDNQHAADLAYYFIFIQRNASDALKWAQINWQSAKEADDEKLLTLAKIMSQQEAS